MVIVVISSVLRGITDGLENKGVSQITYYVTYLLIVTIVMKNFSNIINMVKTSIESLVAFTNCLIPLLITLMITTGNIASAGMLQPIILWIISFIKKKEEQKKLKTNTQELTKLAEKVKILEKEQQESSAPVFKIKQEKVTVEVPKKKVIPPKVVVKETFTSPLGIEPVVTEVIKPKNDETVSEIEILDTKPSTITYKDEVYTKEEAQEELKKIEEQLISQDKEEKQENIKLTNFEEDQEQNAIISLEELLERGKTITQDEIVKHEDDGDEPITLQELEAKWRKDQEVIALKNEEDEDIEILSLDEEKPFSYEDIKVEETKVKVPTMEELFSKNKVPYKPTPVISPIFGIEEDKLSTNNSLSLENTANYDKLDVEIRKTNEFLSRLKELQKKLD